MGFSEAWVMYAVVAMLLFAIANVVLKVLVSDYKVTDTSQWSKILGNVNALALIAGFVIIALVAFGLMLFALRTGKVAIVTAVLALSTVFVAVFSYVFLGDRFSLKETAALGLAVLSILVLVS